MNPNSSSLGVDVTFLLFGAAALAVATPMIGALLRLRGLGAGAATIPGDSAVSGRVPSGGEGGDNEDGNAKVAP